MKLLNKYSRVHLLTAFIIMLLSSVAYYYIIRTILIRQIDKDLRVEEQEILDYIKFNNKLPVASDYKHQLIKFEPADSANLNREILDTKQLSTKDGKTEPYRSLSFPVLANGTPFKAVVYKSQVEAEYLLRLIVGITGLIFSLLFVMIFLINRFVLGKVWQPFFNTLLQLKAFDLHTNKMLSLPPSKVQEFDELNKSVGLMTERVAREYETLKHFTENASHEMQTPLAIIKSKLDLLIQTSTANQTEPLQGIFNATERLTKLNQMLLLLTKIGNNQYQEAEVIDLKQTLEKKITQFEELIKAKNLQIDLNLESSSIRVNKDLLDILLNNLLSNAIRHNNQGGTIECSLTENSLQISNSGPKIDFNHEQIFDRFHKGRNSKGSGLGLAVVKEICDTFGIKITYSYNLAHHISLFFNN